VADTQEVVDDPSVTQVEVGLDGQEDAPSEPPAGDRPGWLPEKFKSPEDLAKAYGELEKKLSQKKPEPAKQDAGLKIDKTQDAPKESASPETVETTVPSDLGELVKAATENYAATGKIDDTVYEAFAKKGISKELVDQFQAGTEALRGAFEGKVLEAAGGREQYAELSQWAAQNLSQEQLDRYNQMVTGGDIESAKLAVCGLQRMYSMAEGTKPNLISGQTSGGAQVPFASWDEVSAAMADPKYSASPAYRKQIEDRLAVSDLSTSG